MKKIKENERNEDLAPDPNTFSNENLHEKLTLLRKNSFPSLPYLWHHPSARSTQQR